MKQILTLLGLVLLTSTSFADTINIAWDKPSPTNGILGYKVYTSLNQFTSILATNTVVGVNSTNVILTTTNGVVYSYYVTAYDTNTPPIESIPSNQIRYSSTNVTVGKVNTLTLTGAASWTGATLGVFPTNGTLSGTAPNLTYSITNFPAKTTDWFTYQIADQFNASPVVNYYFLKYQYVNTPPNLRIDPSSF
jgi:hypothetical protein